MNAEHLASVDAEAADRVRERRREIEVEALTRARTQVEQAKAVLRRAVADLRKMQQDIATGNFNHYALEGMYRNFT